jgi:hypothetical protein
MQLEVRCATEEYSTAALPTPCEYASDSESAAFHNEGTLLLAVGVPARNVYCAVVEHWRLVQM